LNRHIYTEGSALRISKTRNEAQYHNQAEMRKNAFHLKTVTWTENERRKSSGYSLEDLSFVTAGKLRLLGIPDEFTTRDLGQDDW
jgi:hypothetical protein